ncbi:EamA family transporter [Sulfolobus sp. F1]|nr:EamA family transporter [Sulfolobus sp. F1]
MKEKVILFLGGVAFGTAAIFVKLTSLSPPYITFFRFILAGLILLPIRKKVKNNTNTSIKLLIIPSLFLALHMLFFVSSVFLTTIAASTILVSTSPIFAMLLRKRFDVFIITAIIGIIIMNYTTSFGSLLGNMLALLSAICFALYTYFLSKVEYSFLSTAPFIYILSSSFMIPIIPFFSIGEVNLVSILAILGLVLIPTLIGHGSVIYTSNKLPISLVTSAELIEPVVATILAYLIFNQVPSFQQIIGGALTLVSIYFAFTKA